MCETWTLAVLRADDELGGDLPIRVAAGEQLEHFALACGESQRARLGRATVSILRSKADEVELWRVLGARSATTPAEGTKTAPARSASW
jgi:hypothetical protein